MIWPPIRFANNTTKLDPPTPFPSPPTWLLTEAQCKTALAAKPRRKPSRRWRLMPRSRTEWLGTDANGHDVVARLFYGFRSRSCSA